MVKKMTEGKPLTLILQFMIPLLIGNVFQQLYNITDVIIVGRTLGIEALAAVGATISIFMIAVGATIGLTSGMSVIAGQQFGAKNMAGVKNSAATALTISVIYMLFFIVITHIFLEPLLRAIEVPDKIFAQSYNYISILLYGIGTTTLYNLASALMRALGDSKTPLYFLIISSILNIILALVFILVLGWGVTGSAIALVIAEGISGALCLWYIYHKVPALHLQKSDFVLTKSFVWQHLKMGCPMSLQFAILGVGILVLQAVCNSFGPAVIAGFTAAGRVEQLALQPMISVGISMAVYTAQNFGAKRLDRVRQGVKNGSIILLIFSVTAGITSYFFGPEIIKLFIDANDQATIEAGVTYLHTTVPFYIFLSQIFIFRNATQGLGLSFMPFGSGVVELVARSAAAIILGRQFGYLGMCYASPFSWLGACTFLAIGYFYFMRVLEKHNTPRQI